MDTENLIAAAAEAAENEAVRADDTPAQVEADDVEAEAEPEAKPEPEKLEDESPAKRARRSRIERLTRQRDEERDRAARLEAENTALKGKLGNPPKPDDFDDPDEYERARTRHAIREARLEDADATLETHREAVTTAEKERVAALREDFLERAAEFRARAPDFDAAIAQAGAVLPNEIANGIAEMEGGEAIAYHIGKNPELGAEIAALPPTQAAMRVGALAASLKRQERKVKSSAPPPAGPVTGGGGPTEPNPDKMSYADHVKWMESRGL